MIWLELFLTFMKIGAFTFGGGYAMLPLIQDEVESHGWLTDAELVDFIAVSESTPVPSPSTSPPLSECEPVEFSVPSAPPLA